LVICPPGQNPALLVPEFQHARSGSEGYLLEVIPSKVCIRGQDMPGLFYGVMTLCQMLQGAQHNQIPSLTIEDWPDMTFRGFGPFAGGHRFDQHPDNTICLRKIVEAMALNKLNHIAFESESFKSDEGLRQFGEFCRVNFIEPVPLHPFLGMAHQSVVRYVEATDMEFTEIMRPAQRAIDLLQPKVLCIGADEMVSAYDHTARKSIYTKAQRDKHAPHEWLALCLNRFHQYIKERGAEMAVWADALINEENFVGFPCIINGFGGPPDCHGRAAGLLPKDIIMWDWHYESAPVYPTLVYLQKEGFRTVGCPWYALANPEMFSEYGVKTATEKFLGMLGCNWTHPRDLAGIEPLIARDGDCFWSTGKYRDATPAFERYRSLLVRNPLNEIPRGEHRIVIEADALSGSMPLLVYSAGARSAVLRNDGIGPKQERTVDVWYLFTTAAGCAFETCQVNLLLNEAFDGSVTFCDTAAWNNVAEVARLDKVADHSLDLTTRVKGKNSFRLAFRGRNMSKAAAAFLRRLVIVCRVVPNAP